MKIFGYEVIIRKVLSIKAKRKKYYLDLKWYRLENNLCFLCGAKKPTGEKRQMCVRCRTKYNQNMIKFRKRK